MRTKIQNRVKARQKQSNSPCLKLAGVPKYTEEATIKKQIPKDPILYSSKEKQNTKKKKVSESSFSLPHSKPEPLVK